MQFLPRDLSRRFKPASSVRVGPGWLVQVRTHLAGLWVEPPGYLLTFEELDDAFGRIHAGTYTVGTVGKPPIIRAIHELVMDGRPGSAGAGVAASSRRSGAPSPQAGPGAQVDEASANPAGPPRPSPPTVGSIHVDNLWGPVFERVEDAMTKRGLDLRFDPRPAEHVLHATSVDGHHHLTLGADSDGIVRRRLFVAAASIRSDALARAVQVRASVAPGHAELIQRGDVWEVRCWSRQRAGDIARNPDEAVGWLWSSAATLLTLLHEIADQPLVQADRARDTRDPDSPPVTPPKPSTVERSVITTVAASVRRFVTPSRAGAFDPDAYVVHHLFAGGQAGDADGRTRLLVGVRRLGRRLLRPDGTTIRYVPGLLMYLPPVIDESIEHGGCTWVDDQLVCFVDFAHGATTADLAQLLDRSTPPVSPQPVPPAAPAPPPPERPEPAPPPPAPAPPSPTRSGAKSPASSRRRVEPASSGRPGRTPEIMVGQHAEREIESLGPVLQEHLSGAVHDFVRRYWSDPKTVARAYDRVDVPGLPGDFLEIDLNGRDRLVAHWQPEVLTLLTVGDHETVPRFRRMKASVVANIAAARPAEPGYWPMVASSGGKRGASAPSASDAGFFLSRTAPRWDEFPAEDAAEWLYYLSAEQTAVVARINKALDRASTLNQARIFVVGGPGTGKTSVLLVLLKTISRRGLRVGIQLGDSLVEFIEQAGVSVKPSRIPLDREGLAPDYTGFDVVLMDDPSGSSEIEDAINDSYGSARLVVAAFDPCQLTEDLDDETFKSLQSSNGATVQRLRECYRQKATVGSAAKRVMDRVAESSPYFDTKKKEHFREEHQVVYAISNELRFVNAGGREHVVPKADKDDVKSVANEIRRRREWHLEAPSVLVVVDEQTDSSGWPWKTWLHDRRYARVPLTEIAKVKGLEYQWAIIVIRQSLYEELEGGFVGSSRRVYNARRLLRIPFTRARDGVFTLVFPDADRAVFDPFMVR